MNLAQREAIQVFLRQVMATITNIRLYSSDHPQVEHLLDLALPSFEEAIGMEHSLSLLVVNNELVLQGRPLPQSLYSQHFQRLLVERGIGHLKLTQGITREELQSFVVRLSRPVESLSDGMRSTPHIVLGRTEFSEGLTGQQDQSEDLSPEEAQDFLEDLSGKDLTRFMDLFDAVKSKRKFNMSAISELVAGFIKVFACESDPLLALAPLRAMDEYTFTHSTNVCILNLAQAASLGLKGPVLHDIGIAGMLHDIGKLFVPEEILNKPGKLDDDEWAQICQHPVRGAQYLLGSTGIPQLAVITAFEHHMRYDLTGYPKVSPGWKLNLCSQLTMVSDTFDAIRTSRSYQEAGGQEYAMSILNKLSGKALNPGLVKNFAKVLRQQSLDARLSPPPKAG